MITGTPQEEDIGGKEGFGGGPDSSMEDVTSEQLQLNESYNGWIAGGGRSSSSFPRGKRVPPFLTKVYEMVNDPKSNAIISWSSSGTSFTVWDHHIFSKEILPKYFRHDNFSSFVYQLNNYGFNKINWGQWEYENKWFQQGKDHLLMNIKRKNQNPPVMKRNRGIKPCINSGNLLVNEAHLENLRADQNQLKVEVQGLVKKQEYMENDLVTIKEQIHSLFKQQKMVIFMASAFFPKHAQQFKQQMRQEGERDLIDEGEIAEKRNVSSESTENPMVLIDGPDNSSQSITENNQVQPEKQTAFSCDDSGNLVQNQTGNADSETYVPSTNSENCLLLENLMAVDENEQQGELEKQQSKIVMELEDLIGTPAEWGYMKEFMYQVDFQESKPVIPLPEGEGKVV